MCCGAIVIRTPSSGWQDQVIEGRTGYVIPFNDPAALAGAIERVADSPDRAAMRKAAIRLASTKFAKSTMIRGTSALYREMAAAKRLRHSHHRQ
jgi:glycosyltransferase involved in cell wall biosynthesis